ncbi:MAG: hypothetical protein ACP5XB_13235 [Isosphaeraceae bacterium]
MATESRLFDSCKQTRIAIQRLEEAGFDPGQIGSGTRLVMVMAEDDMADLAREILREVDHETR